MSGDAPPLPFSDTVAILKALADTDAVLVGGQALNYWCDFYARRVTELSREQPFTSKDIDFHGTSDAARLLAARIPGDARIPDFDDATPNSAVVVFTDAAGHERTVDFLKHVAGVPDDLVATAVPIQIEGVEIRVMNPLFCLESRAHNVIDLHAYYDNPHGRKQLRCSVYCAREFVRDAIDAGETRRALDMIERIFRLCRSPVGLKVIVEKRIDLFGAIEPHSALPTQFRERRYPQMDATLSSSRARYEQRMARRN